MNTVKINQKKYPPAPNPHTKTISMLRAAGIESDDVEEASIDFNGYWTFDRNADGDRIFAKSGMQRTFHGWPDTVEVGHLVYVWWKESGSPRMEFFA